MQELMQNVKLGDKLNEKSEQTLLEEQSDQELELLLILFEFIIQIFK